MEFFDSQSQAGPARGAEQVGGNRVSRGNRPLEQQRPSAVRLFADPVRDGGYFQQRVDLNGYTGELVRRFEEGDKRVQI